MTLACVAGLFSLAWGHTALATEDVRITGAADEKRIKGKSTIYYTIPADASLIARVAGPVTVTVKLANHRVTKRGPPSVVALTIDGEPYEQLRLPCRPTSRRFSVGRIHPCMPIVNLIVLGGGEHAIGFRIVQSEHGVSVQIGADTASASAQAAGEDLPSLDLVEIEDIWDEEPAAGSGAATAASETTAAAPAEPPPATVEIETAAPSPLGRAARNPFTWTAVGIGVAATGVAICFGSDSQQRFNKAQSGTQVHVQRNLKKARTSALVANVLFGLAGVAGITGGVLFYLDLSADPAAPGAPGESTEAKTWILGASFPW